MIPRAREAPDTVWWRFRTRHDAFSARLHGGLHAFHARPAAERAVDVFHALSEHLLPAVSVSIHDGRTERRWDGRAVALIDVREAIARLKTELAAHAGVGWVVWSDADQLTLTPMLDVWCLSRSDRWAHLFGGMGLREQHGIPPRSWQLTEGGFPPSPTTTAMVEDAATRLGLTAA